MPEDVDAWERLESEAVHDARIFRLQRERSRSPRTGAAHTFYRLEAPDWVNVIPLTPAGDVVMVRQYRHGAQATTLEIPGGMVDPGESAEAAAARELLEETGYAAPTVELLGSVNPNPALFSNQCSTWLASGASRIAPIRNEGAEETQVVLVPAAEIPERIRRGGITHALVIAAFHWYGLAS